MAPVIITMVRHGESKDNLTALWAGHRDAPLSNHGYNQAQRLGQAFADVPITAIYASDLKRAQTTARCIHGANRTSPKPPFTVSPLLREQFFGEAEGAPWDAGKYSSAHLPWEDHRAFCIAPNAESLNDVARRADLVLRHFVLPHVLATAHVPPDASFPDQHHIVLVAHGIWLSEMLFALKRSGDPHIRFVETGSYTNTGWARIELELDNPEALHALPSSATSPEDELTREAANGQLVSSPPAPSEAAPSAPPSVPAPPGAGVSGMRARNQGQRRFRRCLHVPVLQARNSGPMLPAQKCCRRSAILDHAGLSAGVLSAPLHPPIVPVPPTSAALKVPALSSAPTTPLPPLTVASLPLADGVSTFSASMGDDRLFWESLFPGQASDWSWLDQQPAEDVLVSGI